MKLIGTLLMLFMFVICISAQSDLQKMAATEGEFEAFAEKHGNKAAFIEFAAADGVLFTPDRVNAKAHWNGRGEWNGLLSWAPNFADISADAMIGYTYGNWEFRPKGRGGDAVAFGQFITLWKRQSDGKYRYVIDIGIDHDKPARYSTEWVTASVKSSDLNKKNLSAGDTVRKFYDKLAVDGSVKAYKAFAIDDVRVFRQGEPPIIGIKAVDEAFKGEKGSYTFGKQGSYFGSADIAYNLNTYTKTLGGKTVEQGNTLQIWKLVNGRWRIVLDIFKPAA